MSWLLCRFLFVQEMLLHGMCYGSLLPREYTEVFLYLVVGMTEMTLSHNLTEVRSQSVEPFDDTLW